MHLSLPMGFPLLLDEIFYVGSFAYKLMQLKYVSRICHVRAFLGYCWIVAGLDACVTFT